MVGEKYLNKDQYLLGQDGGDNESMYIGDNADITRWTGTDNISIAPGYMLPIHDRAGYTNYNLFGSAHPTAINCAMCDGSVHSITYTIDGPTFSHLGSRNDGKAIDGNAY